MEISNTLVFVLVRVEAVTLILIMIIFGIGYWTSARRLINYLENHNLTKEMDLLGIRAWPKIAGMRVVGMKYLKNFKAFYSTVSQDRELNDLKKKVLSWRGCIKRLLLLWTVFFFTTTIAIFIIFALL